MSLTLVGLSHKTAPVELREKLAFSLDELETFLVQAKQDSPFNECAILSTCNRTEIYGYHSQMPGSPGGESPLEWCKNFLSRRFQRGDIENFIYIKQGEEIVSHLFKVASGLDSMVFGENEIVKQVKDSYLLSHKLGWTGKQLNVLFQRALYVGKLVRTHTSIGQGSASVGAVAVSLSEKIFGDLSKSTVIIFGAGKMAEMTAKYLLSKKVGRLLVANRNMENAKKLAKLFGAKPLTLDEGLVAMVDADIVITSASSPEPLLLEKFINELMAKRQNRSLFIIDIAVPRNVDPKAHLIDNVYLYNIDDLESIVRENLRNRSEQVEKADTIVREKSGEFFRWVESLESGKEKSLKHSVPEHTAS